MNRGNRDCDRKVGNNPKNIDLVLDFKTRIRIRRPERGIFRLGVGFLKEIKFLYPQ